MFSSSIKRTLAKILMQNSTFDDDATFVSLAHTLKLILVIKDLALTNRVLREDWQTWRLPILKLVRDLASSRLGMESERFS